MARFLEPPLSTILVPHEDMGQRAVADGPSALEVLKTELAHLTFSDVKRS